MRRRRATWAAGGFVTLALFGSLTVVAQSMPAPVSAQSQAPVSAQSKSPATPQSTPEIGSEAFSDRGDAQPDQQAPLSGKEIRRLLTEDASKPRFDGTVRGWRLAPLSVLEAEGLADRNLARSCEPSAAGEEIATELDFTVTYFPTEVTITEQSAPSKWVCGGDGLSVEQAYTLDTPFGSGDLAVYRAIWGRRTFGTFAPADRVEAETINGKPAIFIHPADDESGLGYGRIIVLEDDTEPEFTILHVSADNGVPFAELIKIAEGIR